jgi:hypothetical protein
MVERLFLTNQPSDAQKRQLDKEVMIYSAMASVFQTDEL